MGRTGHRGRPWGSQDRTGGPIDEVLAQVRRAVPGLRVERLAGTHAVDDDNVYFLGDELEPDRVQVDTGPSGQPPFVIEAADRCETRDLADAVRTIVDWLAVDDSIRDTLSRLWDEHRGTPFPARLRGKDVGEIDFMLVDADIAGCVHTLLARGSTSSRAVLQMRINHLSVVLPLLTDDLEFAYYDRLRVMAELATWQMAERVQVLESAPSPSTARIMPATRSRPAWSAAMSSGATTMPTTPDFDRSSPGQRCLVRH
jgi:hypothetical protein